MLNPWKLIVMLALFIAYAWVKQSGPSDPSTVIGVASRWLDWRADILPVPVSLVVGTAAGLYAIYDGARQALSERRAKADTVSVVRF